MRRTGAGAPQAGPAWGRLCEAGLKAQARLRDRLAPRQFRAARCMAVWTARLP
ncbi:MAG TPA: hypothetical protein VFX95_07110 [Caulobacteraceae bacterium]|nr:hypothetical protein [Caulobacteraceae bacterium]